MDHRSYVERRGEIEHYFDRTAAKAWEVLTSNAPVGRIRATVRAGRDRMRGMLLSWLPENMEGLRLLDAGCGTGALASEAMRRGAQVVAIDLSPTLVDLARQRHLKELHQDPTLGARGGQIEFGAGDMLTDSLGSFDHVVCMDSLIHYDTPDIVKAVNRLSERTRSSIIFTFAPHTPWLGLMHSVGRLFPRSDRSPSLQPVLTWDLKCGFRRTIATTGWQAGRSQRISSGFYTSHAWEWTRT